jgi:uncharacterized surface protein with fasciclin (FAS1) repeats
MRSTRLSPAKAVVCSLWIAGCGTEDMPGPGATAPASIADLAAGSADLTTLSDAVHAAGLDEALAGAGPFTVFAPTDAAFAALSPLELHTLLEDPEELRRVLSFHVVAGRADAVALGSFGAATTLEGSRLTFRAEGGDVFVGEARVIQADVHADNGIIQIIDRVLMPPPRPKTIAELAAETPDLSTLFTAVGAAGLAELLDGPGPFTVFAPTNAAFAALPPGVLEAVLADRDTLTAILAYHVVGAKLDAAAVSAAPSAVTLQGIELPFQTEAGSVFADRGRVITADIGASNGVVHLIDAVLLPPSVRDLIARQAELSTLSTAIEAAMLEETLSGPGPFTIFAPINDAFAALPAGTVEGLLADIPALSRVLTYHVAPERLLAADVIARPEITTVAGAALDVHIAGGGAEVRVGGAKVIRTDVLGKNGVVHWIDGVLIPPSM